MSFNLLELSKNLFTTELVSKASAYLGEKEGNVSKAISSIIPSLLGIFAEKTASPAGTASLSTMISNQINSGSHNNLGSFFGNDGGSLLNKGANMARELFGNKLDKLTNTISGHADIKPSSTTSLLSMAVPAVLGMLGKVSSENAGNVSSLLKDQKSSILGAIPSGINFSNLFSSAEAKVSDIGNKSVHYVKEVEKAGSGMRWLLPILLLVLAAMAAWYFFGKGCNSATGDDSKKDAVTVNTDGTNANPVAFVKGKIDSLTGDYMYNEGDSTTITLPNNGGNITVGKYSTEANLVEFLTNKDKVVDTVKGNWFEFTNVHFKTGSSDITEGSKKQLNNIVAICKAFGDARFKLGGYTDSTASLQTNIAVSQKRADAVASYLKTAGVPPVSFTGTKGYGPEWPIADNATPEGRAQNRRVAVNVKSK
jgi:outer membrane protein OmpA-like peptidoglycan-associated protein